VRLGEEEIPTVGEGGNFVVFRSVGGGVKIVINAKDMIWQGGSDGRVPVADVDCERTGLDRFDSMDPGTVGEARDAGVRGEVEEAKAALVGTEAQFGDNGHVAGETEVEVNEGEEMWERGGGEVSTGVVAVGVFVEGGRVNVVTEVRAW